MHYVREAESDDSQRIAEIQVAGWKHCYRGVVADAHLDAMEVSDRRIAFWQKQSQNEKSEILVSEIDGEITGFCNRIWSRDEDGGSNWEIAAIYVAPLYLRQGYGRLLCRSLFESAIVSEIPFVTLWVLSENKIGRQFYEKMGFCPDGAIKRIAISGYELEETRYRIDPKNSGENAIS